MATPIDTVINKKMDDIGKKLDRQNSLYLAHSKEFEEMIYSFLEQMSIALEINNLEKEGNKGKEIENKQRKILKKMEENKKRILVFGNEITIRLFGYFTNMNDYMEKKGYKGDDRLLMMLIIRCFLIASLRTGLNFERTDRVSSFLMFELKDYYKKIYPLEKKAIKMTEDFSKEIGLELKW